MPKVKTLNPASSNALWDSLFISLWTDKIVFLKLATKTCYCEYNRNFNTIFADIIVKHHD